MYSFISWLVQIALILLQEQDHASNGPRSFAGSRRGVMELNALLWRCSVAMKHRFQISPLSSWVFMKIKQRISWGELWKEQPFLYQQQMDKTLALKQHNLYLIEIQCPNLLKFFTASREIKISRDYLWIRRSCFLPLESLLKTTVIYKGAGLLYVLFGQWKQDGEVTCPIQVPRQ